MAGTRFKVFGIGLSRTGTQSLAAAVQRHFEARPPCGPVQGESQQVQMEIRRFLRAAVYGSLRFEPERFGRAWDRHVEHVRRLFAGRPQPLLELDICGGQGWERLAPFLDRAVPEGPFPHRGQGG